jgi:uncharacterized Zn-finger protein
MMKSKRYNLNAQEKVQRQLKRAELIQQKEKSFVDEPWQGYCDNEDHPRFTIKVTVDKPWAVCYYCSKMWILGDKNG